MNTEQKQPPAVEAEATPGERVIEAAKEAVAVAKGEAAAIWHVMDSKTVAAYGPWVRFTDHEAALKAKTDEIERLRRELDEARADANDHLIEIDFWKQSRQRLKQKRDAAEASNKALREGLEPFAAVFDRLSSWAEAKEGRDIPEDDEAYEVLLFIGDLRRARALLSETGDE